MGIAFVAVVVLTIDYGRPPWVALVLAFSFGTYGLLKKQAAVGAVESITFETVVLAPIAMAYIAVAGRRPASPTSAPTGSATRCSSPRPASSPRSR